MNAFQYHTLEDKHDCQDDTLASASRRVLPARSATCLQRIERWLICSTQTLIPSSKPPLPAPGWTTSALVADGYELPLEFCTATPKSILWLHVGVKVACASAPLPCRKTKLAECRDTPMGFSSTSRTGCDRPIDAKQYVAGAIKYCSSRRHLGLDARRTCHRLRGAMLK
jgi:hypothetical protein